MCPRANPLPLPETPFDRPCGRRRPLDASHARRGAVAGSRRGGARPALRHTGPGECKEVDLLGRRRAPQTLRPRMRAIHRQGQVLGPPRHQASPRQARGQEEAGGGETGGSGSHDTGELRRRERPRAGSGRNLLVCRRRRTDLRRPLEPGALEQRLQAALPRRSRGQLGRWRNHLRRRGELGMQLRHGRWLGEFGRTGLRRRKHPDRGARWLLLVRRWQRTGLRRRFEPDALQRRLDAALRIGDKRRAPRLSVCSAPGRLQGTGRDALIGGTRVREPRAVQHDRGGREAQPRGGRQQRPIA